MTPIVILADGALSFLIYLVIAVVWMIGQVAQQREAKRKAEEMKRKREEREKNGEVPDRRQKSIENDLEDFLGRVIGQPSRPPDPPPPKPAVIQFDKPYAPPPIPQKETPVPVPPVKISKALKRQARIDDISDVDVYDNVKEIEDVAEMALEASIEGSGLEVEALLNVRTMMVDMSRVNVPLQVIPIQNNRTVHTKTTKPNVHNRKALKQAIVSGILLNPPKALQADPFQAETGGL